MSLQRKTKLGLLGVAFMMGFALAPSDRSAVHAVGNGAGADEEVTLTGCIIRGEDDGKGFLLTNVLPASIDQSTRAAVQAAPNAEAAGTSGTLPGASTVIYWLDDLDDDDDLPTYAGKRVEVRGELEGDIDRGEMEIEREGDWVEIDIKADGKEVKTRLPYVSVMPNAGPGAVGTSGGMKDDDEIELNINVRKLDVKDVKIVAGECK